MTIARVLALFVLTTLLSYPSVYADALPPEAIDCWAKKFGDACTDRATNKAGSCEDGTCSSKKLDAGGTYACLTCSGAPPSTDDGACAIAKPSTARQMGPWLLAGAASLLFLLGRRRRRG